MPASLARKGHDQFAPLTAPADTPLGRGEREVLDTVAESGPLTFDALASLLPHRRRGGLQGVVRGLGFVGELAYDKRTRTWHRAA